MYNIMEDLIADQLDRDIMDMMLTSHKRQRHLLTYDNESVDFMMYYIEKLHKVIDDIEAQKDVE